jgi:cell division protein FtsW
VIFLAYSLAKRGDKVRSFLYGFLPNVVLPGLLIGLVLLEDLGTAVHLSLVVLAVAYAGGIRLGHLILGMAVAAPLAYCQVRFVPFRWERILAWRDPFAYATGAGFQLTQSLLAFGAGGLWGVGLGDSRQKLFYLPEGHTDFVLSILAEELGLGGVLSVLLLTALLVLCGFRIAQRQTEPFRRLLATGIVAWIGLQAGLNALVVTGGLPTFGLSFPFLSYGGSGFVASWAAMGVLAGLARNEHR